VLCTIVLQEHAAKKQHTHATSDLQLTMNLNQNNRSVHTPEHTQKSPLLVFDSAARFAPAHQNYW
jgi:hypothetical protein